MPKNRSNERMIMWQRNREKVLLRGGGSFVTSVPWIKIRTIAAPRSICKFWAQANKSICLGRGRYNLLVNKKWWEPL